jgi:putative DNA primase/helicase
MSIISPSSLSVPGPSAAEKPEKRPFPRRVELDGFPDQPGPGSNKPPVTLDNVKHLLVESGVEAGYDVIKKRVSLQHGTTNLEECDLISLANLNGMMSNWFLDFVGTLARRNPINPVAAWIDSKPWDGTDRLPALYDTVQVAEGYPVHARNFLLHRWLLSCTAAALEVVGFKARGVLTLQGEQGIGKTSWIARLVPKPINAEWIKLDHHLDAHNKDSIFGAMTHWIVEIGELDSSLKKDIARTKGLLTNDCDKLRLPYTKTALEMPRRTVFAGTVNEWNFLIDQTGNTRWWTLPVVSLDFKHDIDMQQVFAQLAVEYRKGEQWWLNEHEETLLNDLNSQHQVVSPIEERIRERVDPKGKNARSMTATKVLEEIGFKTPSNAQCKECGAVLRSIYGPPKRVQGIMKWKVALLGPNMAEWQAEAADEEY